MQRRWSAKLAMAAMSTLLAVGAYAQDPTAPTPLHPISTKPEGNAPGCSFSATKTNGTAPTGSSTCPPPAADTAPPAPALGQPAAAAQNTAPQPNASQRFPFPGEATIPDMPADGASPSAPQPATGAPAAPSPANGAGSGQPADANGFHDAGSSGSSSSSSSSSSSADDAPTGDTSPLGDQAPAPKRGRKKLPPVARQTPDERETEDITVAKFYMNDNNWRGAYLRGKDAVTITDGDWEAHLTVAEAARKLGKLDEAQKEYRRTLELDPLPKGRKEAETALKEMGGSSGDSLLP